jgi:hypothetical protein
MNAVDRTTGFFVAPGDVIAGSVRACARTRLAHARAAMVAG